MKNQSQPTMTQTTTNAKNSNLGWLAVCREIVAQWGCALADL